MIEAIAFLPLMFWLVYLMCNNCDDKPSKPTGNSFAELEAYINGMRMALENEKNE